ncbi:hypothetical protein JOS77_30735 [Chromobacterium haemolyticum]|nr:hypothetical protein JOS77_30735 [Chromobacterium haemolyticum]
MANKVLAMESQSKNSRKAWDFVKFAGGEINSALSRRNQVLDELVKASESGSLSKLITDIVKVNDRKLTLDVIGNPVTVLLQIVFKSNDTPIKVSFFVGNGEDGLKPFYSASVLNLLAWDCHGDLITRGIPLNAVHSCSSHI